MHRLSNLDELAGRRWEVLALTCTGAFLAPLDVAAVSVALPVISPALRLGFGSSMWVQAAYLLAWAVLLIPAGKLADEYGRMRFFMIGVLVFTIGSALAASSMSAGWLVAARAVQGAGGGLLGSTAAAVATAVFPPSERGRALGIYVMAVYLGLSLGPPLGGFLVGTFGWRSIFVVNLPVGVALLLWTWRLMPRDERGSSPARIDASGALLLGVFLCTLLLPLTFGPDWGWFSWPVAGLLGASIFSLTAFILVELRSDAPMLDLGLVMHNRLFAAANMAALLNYMALYAITMLTAIFLQVVQGRSPQEAGWLLLAAPVVEAVLSPLAGRWSDRIGSRLLTTAGMMLIAVGMIMLGTIAMSSSGLRIFASLAVVGVGLASFSAPNTSAVLGSVSRDHVGLASGLLSTVRAVGMALSVAILGGFAGSRLGRLGGRLLYSNTGTLLSTRAAGDYAHGYSLAMYAGAGFALLGAAASLVRGSGGEIELASSIGRQPAGQAKSGQSLADVRSVQCG